MADSEAGEQRRRAGRLRLWLLAIICVLYVFSVPWYRSADEPVRVWLGLPDWVTTAILCYFAAAILNAWAWWITDVRDPEEATGEVVESSESAP